MEKRVDNPWAVLYKSGEAVGVGRIEKLERFCGDDFDYAMIDPANGNCFKIYRENNYKSFETIIEALDACSVKYNRELMFHFFDQREVLEDYFDKK